MRAKQILMGLLVTVLYQAVAHSATDKCLGPAKLTRGIKGYAPATIRQFNGAHKLKICGNGQTVAVVIGNLGNLLADLTVYSKTFGLPLPDDSNFAILTPDGTCNNKVGSPLEAHIDAEMVHLMAPQAKILVVCPGDSSVQARGRAIQAAIDNGASVVSMSWGAPEQQSDIDVLDPIFAANAGSVTFLAGAGDSGANIDDQGNPRVAYPASSSYVLAVGATIDKGEENPGVWAKSGGGISQLIAAPAYQGWLQGGGRIVPDFTVNGASDTLTAVYTQGRWVAAAGTSVSSPLAAGMVALANQKHGSPLGQIHDRIYQINTDGLHTTYFRDILEGDNGYYSANEGFDFVSGFGNPRMDLLVKYLAK